MEKKKHYQSAGGHLFKGLSTEQNFSIFVTDAAGMLLLMLAEYDAFSQVDYIQCLWWGTADLPLQPIKKKGKERRKTTNEDKSI